MVYYLVEIPHGPILFIWHIPSLWAHVSWTIEDGPKATIIYSIYIGLKSLIDVMVAGGCASNVGGCLGAGDVCLGTGDVLSWS
jgi:hypothetical protein